MATAVRASWIRTFHSQAQVSSAKVRLPSDGHAVEKERVRVWRARAAPVHGTFIGRRVRRRCACVHTGSTVICRRIAQLARDEGGRRRRRCPNRPPPKPRSWRACSGAQ
eukprot:4163260-Pyramimonas_sp.AAC.1